jgi:hypothetical protein
MTSNISIVCDNWASSLEVIAAAMLLILLCNGIRDDPNAGAAAKAKRRTQTSSFAAKLACVNDLTEFPDTALSIAVCMPNRPAHVSAHRELLECPVLDGIWTQPPRRRTV